MWISLLTAQMQSLPKAPAVQDEQRYQLHAETKEVPCRVTAGQILMDLLFWKLKHIIVSLQPDVSAEYSHQTLPLCLSGIRCGGTLSQGLYCFY